MSKDQIDLKFKKVSEDNNSTAASVEEKGDTEQINTIFDEDRDKFIGEFKCKEYSIIRGYINGSGTHLRLYYTKVQPNTPA